LGCLIAINSDAHHPSHFELAHFGVGTARRAWATPETVINSWPVEKLLHWLDERGHRRMRNGPKPAPVVLPAPEVSRPKPKTGPAPAPKIKAMLKVKRKPAVFKKSSTAKRSSKTKSK